MNLSSTNQSDENACPAISVLVATYNRAQMLKIAIESVLSQTYRDFELIIVSDGSTDKTAQVVASFEDSRIKLFEHNRNMGYAAARNTGLKASRGKYIAFLDDDDEWLPHKLEIQLPVIEYSRPNVGLVYAWMEYYDIDKMIKKYTPEIRGDVFVEMLDKQAIGGCPTIIIKREVLEKIGYLDTELGRGADGDYWRRVTKYYHVDFVAEVLVKVHTGHPDRISVDSQENLRNVIITLEKRLRNFKDDFYKFPVRKANVLSQIALTCFETWQFGKGLRYTKKMLRCHSGSVHKSKLLYSIARRLAGFTLKSILYFKRAQR